MAMADIKELPSAFIAHHNLSNSAECEPFKCSVLSESNVVEQQHIATSSSSDYLIEESGRGCRTKRKQIDPLVCPVCSVTVRPNELETHYLSELTKLDKLSSSNSSKQRKTMSASPPATRTAVDDATMPIAPEKCWETYQTVKANRQSRLKLKSRKRKPDETVNCPVCNRPISGDLNQHVEDCLRKNGDTHSSDEDVDVVDVEENASDDFSEYEWAGQHRVRAASMLEGGYGAAGVGIRMIKSDACEEEDLIVDGDDTVDKYGPAQYTERDIMLVNKGEDKDQTTLRLAIIGVDPSNNSDDIASADDDSAELLRNESDLRSVDDDASTRFSSASPSQNATIEALKQRVRELEKCENNKGQYKCLICMGRYKTPVISICCWHVHCELCWLKTLGIKKLCPQCNMITSPTDLRKVYI